MAASRIEQVASLRHLNFQETSVQTEMPNGGMQPEFNALNSDAVGYPMGFTGRAHNAEVTGNSRRVCIRPPPRPGWGRP